MANCHRINDFTPLPIWPNNLKEDIPIPTHEYFSVFIVPLNDSNDLSDINKLGPHQTSTICLKPREAPSYQIHLPHGTKYAIGVMNLWNAKIVSKITIGNKVIGHFQIGPKKTEVIFRPTQDDKSFIFFSQDSQIGHEISEIQGSGSKNSLIDIEIWPEDMLCAEDGFQTKYFTLDTLDGKAAQASNPTIQRKWTKSSNKFGATAAAAACDSSPAFAFGSSPAWHPFTRSGLRCETDGGPPSKSAKLGHTVLSGPTYKKYISLPPIKTRGVLYYRVNLRVGGLETNNPNVCYLFNNNFVSYAPYCINNLNESNTPCDG